MENTPTTSQPVKHPAPARYRVIEGTLYARHTEPYAQDIKIHVLGYGHTEATVQPRYGWSEVAQLAPSALNDAAMCEGNIFVDGAWVPYVQTEAEKLDKLTRNRERSSRRARTKVRRLCKNRGLSVMLTLTYRENMQDRARMARDFDVFMKRVRRAIPDFQYVCVFERQTRGAWHAHIAVPRVLSHYLHKGVLLRSYDFLRSLWRKVVGVDNGNVDVSRNKRVRRSAAKLAAYMAKYIGKGFESGDGEGDSYRSSGRDLPPPVVIRSLSPSGALACEHLLELLSIELGGRCEFHHALLDGGGHYVSIFNK